MRRTSAALRIAIVAWLLAMAPRDSSAQALVWAKQFGGPGVVGAKSVVVDSSGNVYTTGTFTNTTDFDPGPGIYNLVGGTQPAAFVSKLDANGNLVWAGKLLGFGATYAQAIAVDGTGNVYTTGTFFSTTDFDPGPGTYNLGPNGGHYLSKLDSAGNFVWATRFGSGSNNSGYSIAVDGAGNVYSTGSFAGVADFDPGPGVFNLTTTGSGDVHSFASKLDASGNFVWARELDGAGAGRSISVDGSGNVYTTGTSSNGTFVWKLDSVGSLVWADHFGSSDTPNSGTGSFSIVVDSVGSVVITGYFKGTADFDPGVGTYNLTSAGDDDGFVSKLDGAGNFVWAKRVGGTAADQVTSVAVDDSGSVYTGGSFGGTADFDPGPNTYNLASGSPEGEFVSKLDGDGNFVWAGQMGRSDLDSRGAFIALDRSGELYVAGKFFGIADFDPTPPDYFLDSRGNYDAFVSKLTQQPSLTFASKSALWWSPMFDGASFNIYRSDSALPGTFVCLEDHHTDTFTSDFAEPAIGALYAYLVTTVAVTGQEGSLGFEAVNGNPTTERPNANPCP